MTNQHLPYREIWVSHLKATAKSLGPRGGGHISAAYSSAPEKWINFMREAGHSTQQIAEFEHLNFGGVRKQLAMAN